MLNLTLIQEEFHNVLLEARSIEYVLTTPRFMEALDASTEQAKEELHKILNLINKPKLLKWMDKQLENGFESWPVMKLRRHARDLGVPKYGSLTKQLLLSEIVKRKKPHEEKSAGTLQ